MPRIQETIQKVSEFAELREGWYFGEGVLPSQQRIGQAIAFLEYANFGGLERANAFPGIRGQIEVRLYNANRVLEITIEPDDSITIAEDRNREQLSLEENLSKSDAYQRLEEFSQRIWDSSGHFTVNITIPNMKVVVSPVSPWISGVVNRFPSSRWNALSGQAVTYAHILLGSTTSKLAIHKFTGRFGKASYQAPVEWNLRQLQVATSVIGTSTIGAEGPFAEPLSS